jgi:hypothetical protein
MTTFPLTYLGNGQFTTTPYHMKRLDYGQGEIINVEEVQERSQKSHAHYFALITEAWRTLPETLADEFPSAEHLRKRALIDAGYCTETRMAFRTNAEAVAAAAFVGTLDGYAHCSVVDRVVIVRRAESQSMKAMKKERFQRSKDDVLSVIAQLLHTDPASITEAA